VIELAKMPEVAEIKKPEIESFKAIKPESGIKVDEAKAQIEGMFEDKSETNRYIICRNESLEGDNHPITGVPFERKTIDFNGEKIEGVFPEFDDKFESWISDDLYNESDKKQFSECNAQLKEEVEDDPELAMQFTPEQLEQIQNGDTPDGYVWHHNEEPGKLQLVDSETHARTGHTGGRSIWGGGSDNR
jgi:hypothetical protein